MKRFVFLFLVAPALFAAESKQEPKSSDTEVLLRALFPVPIKDVTKENLIQLGFKPLFDGQTLDEWQILGDQQAKFKVAADGGIRGYGKDLKNNSYLCTKKTYKDFIITFQFKFNNLNGNSGFAFRGIYNEENQTPYSYQCEHDNRDRAWSAGLYGEKHGGWIFPNKENEILTNSYTQQGLRLFKKNDWNTFIVKCEGAHIQTWLNGEMRVNYIDDNIQKRSLEGFFGLQVHSGPSCDASWKNLFIKEL